MTGGTDDGALTSSDREMALTEKKERLGITPLDMV